MTAFDIGNTTVAITRPQSRPRSSPRASQESHPYARPAATPKAAPAGTKYRRAGQLPTTPVRQEVLNRRHVIHAAQHSPRPRTCQMDGKPTGERRKPPARGAGASSPGRCRGVASRKTRLGHSNAACQPAGMPPNNSDLRLCVRLGATRRPSGSGRDRAARCRTGSLRKRSHPYRQSEGRANGTRARGSVPETASGRADRTSSAYPAS